MDLDRGWRVQHFDPGDGGEAGTFDPDLDDRAWISAAVPGDVHTSLLAAGAIPEVFYDRNLEAVQWIEDREWWIRTTFQAPPRPDGPEERDLLILNLRPRLNDDRPTSLPAFRSNPLLPCRK